MFWYKLCTIIIQKNQSNHKTYKTKIFHCSDGIVLRQNFHGHVITAAQRVLRKSGEINVTETVVEVWADS